MRMYECPCALCVGYPPDARVTMYQCLNCEDWGHRESFDRACELCLDCETETQKEPTK